LPRFCEDAQEEEAEGDFKRRGREDVEDFAELDELWEVSWRGRIRWKRTYDEGMVDVFEVEEAFLAAPEGYDNDEGAVAGEEQLR
jgi:hypothetical protein